MYGDVDYMATTAYASVCTSDDLRLPQSNCIADLFINRYALRLTGDDRTRIP